MYCFNCGKSILHESKFCRFCGISLNEGTKTDTHEQNQPAHDLQLTEDTKFLKRSGHRVVLAMITSLGLYFLYWINCTLHNLERISKRNFNHDSVTLRMIIPIYNIFVYGEFLNNIKKLQVEYDMDERISVAVHQILFILGYFLFVPFLISMGIVQSQANDVMDKISNGKVRDAQFRWGEITVISLGIILFIFSVLGGGE